jgi:arylsulfatase A-like enzyme
MCSLAASFCPLAIDALFLKEPAAAAFTHSPGSKRGGAHLTRNVITIVVDCLRADHLGCYGYGKKTSPFIDRIAQAGALFENCIAPSSWTIPSVVSLFTGIYPQQHGVNEFGSIIPGDLVSIQ